MAATHVSSSTEPARCYLLELPAELRNHIYTFALTHSKSIEVHSNDPNRQNRDMISYTIPLPPLLKLSTAIKSEALPIYISFNTFRFMLPNCAHVCFGYFDFGTFAPHVPHLTQFEIATEDGFVFAIKIPYGLGSRKIGLLPNEGPQSDAAARVRLWRRADCFEIEDVIDEAATRKGAEARFNVTDLEAIIRCLV